MNKKDNKYKEALGNLFKARGENIETSKKPQKNRAMKSSNEENLEKDILNAKDKTKPQQAANKNKQNNKKVKGALKSQSTIKKIQSKKKETAGSMNDDPKRQKVETKKQANTPKKSSIDNKTNKKNTSKLLKEKNNAPKHPPGYFVMNHAAKLKSQNNEKPKVAAKKNKSNNKANGAKSTLPMQTKKRKASKENGPLNKVYKKQKIHFDSEASSDNTDTDTAGDLKKLNRFVSPHDDFDENSYTSLTDETDTTEDYSDSYDDETFSDDYDEEDEYSFESDDLDDTYSCSESESDIVYSDAASFDSIHDPDYELPKTVLEDHIIHKGLAVKHDFSAEHDVQFDEHNENGQIVELPSVVNTVEQHIYLNVEHLRTLEIDYVEKATTQLKNIEDVDECPQLVPIDDVDFRLWTSGIEMDDEIFSECTDYALDSDEESITAAEGNINHKYLRNGNNDESVESFSEEDDDANDELKGSKQPNGINIKADVIVAKQENLNTFELGESEMNASKESSLSEIMTEARAFFEMWKAVFKTTEIWNTNDEDEEENFIEKPGAIQTSADIPNKQMPENMNESTLESTDIETLMDESDVLDSPQNSTPDFSNEPMAETATQPETMPEDLQSHKFQTIFFDSTDSHSVLVLLKNSFYIYGTIKATLIAGSAEVFGYNLKKGIAQQLFSPRGVCALQISPILNPAHEPKTSVDNDEILAAINNFACECEFQPGHLDQLLENFEDSTDAILLLSRNDEADNIKSILQSHVKENIFPAQIPQSRPFYTSEFLLDCMINVHTEYPLHIPPQWHNLPLASNSKHLLLGGKSVGKSTLLRFLVNQHLNKFPAVLVIDLDIGQPEIFASQAVSCAFIEQPLLGPGFLYAIQPEKAYCVAHTNIVLCAHRYIQSVLQLLKYCNDEPRYQHIPWIVNTMGYNKGFGAELIAVITEHLRPTDVVQLQSNVPINNFDFLFEPHVVPTIERNIFNRLEYAAENKTVLSHRLHVLPTAVLQQGRYQREWQMSAKDMRYVMLLTQLSQILNESNEVLNQKQTYCVNIDVIKIVNPLFKRSTTMEAAKSLISNLVYLAHCDAECEELDTIECYGIGIVRAIDWPARQLYLLTALPSTQLRNVNTLALGDMPLPASMLTLQNLDADVDVPYVQNVADEATSRAIRQFYSRT